MKFTLSSWAAAAVTTTTLLALPRPIVAPFTQCRFSLEVMITHDWSDSALISRGVIADQTKGIANHIAAAYPESKTGFSNFVDKPLTPFGYPYQGWWFEGDWCHNVTTKISDVGTTDDEAIAVLAEIPYGGGNDWPENQLGVLHDFAISDELVGWSGDAITTGGLPIFRMIIMSTDGPYHIAGDGASSKNNLTPNNGVGVTDCEGEDYPTIAQVREALLHRGVFPVFLVPNDGVNDLFSVYEELLQSLDIPGLVMSVAEDISDMAAKMIEAFMEFNEYVCAKTTFDLLFSQDVTYSYSNDAPNFQGRVATLLDDLSQNSTFVTPHYALTSFGDKPMLPFGHGPSGDYCFRIDQLFTTVATDVVNAASNLVLTSGADWRESQLDAIISSAKHTDLTWRTGTAWNGFKLVRFLVLATDSGYHREGDAAAGGHPGLNVHTGGPLTSVGMCLAQQYPTWLPVAAALTASGSHFIHLMFVVTNDIKSIYFDLQAKFATLGIESSVVPIDDFSEMPMAIATEVRRLMAEPITLENCTFQQCCEIPDVELPASCVNP